MPLPDPNHAYAELCGVLGRPNLGPGAVTLRVHNVAMARRGFRLMKLLGLQPRLQSRREGRIQFTLQGQVPILAAPVTLPADAWLAGCFLVRGYLGHPESGAAQLEFWVSDVEVRDLVVGTLASLHLRAKVLPRRGGYLVYLKDRSQIRSFLGYVGAHRAMLQWESIDVLRRMKNQVNRLVNSETANLRRTVESGITQAELLRGLVARGDDKYWSDTSRALASLRVQHPDWSLKELGEAMLPRLSKSAVNHRMRKLLQGESIEPKG